MLRPHGVDGQKDGHLSEVDPLPSFTLADAQIHDINVVPHLHREDEIEKLFPKLRQRLRQIARGTGSRLKMAPRGA